jgi:hypothetical protein
MTMIQEGHAPVNVAGLLALGYEECEDELFKKCYQRSVRIEGDVLKVYHDPRNQSVNFFQEVTSFSRFVDFVEWLEMQGELGDFANPNRIPHSEMVLSTPETLKELGFVSVNVPYEDYGIFRHADGKYPLELKLRRMHNNPNTEVIWLEVYLANTEERLCSVSLAEFEHHPHFVRWLELTYPGK